MKKGMLVALILAVGCIFLSSEASAAWTQAKGHSYNQLTLSHYKTVEKFTTLGHDSGGNLVDLNAPVHRVETEEFNNTTMSYYLEYGITDKITGIMSGGWSWVRSDDIVRYNANSGPSGVGDINLGLRHKLMDNIANTGVLSSVEFTVKVPEAYDYKNPAYYQNLGDGQYDMTGKLKFGRGFNWGYSVLDIAYIYRFENNQLDPINFKPSDQLKIALSGGYNATSWLSIRGQVQWLESMGNAEVSDEMVTSFYTASGARTSGEVVIIKDSLALEQDVLSAGIDLAITVKPGMQVVLSYNTDFSRIGTIKKSKNAALGNTISLAIAYSL